jgi:nucleotide-binding universal stress UspA family protein
MSAADKRPEDADSGRIVVGVDGSDASKDALAWAARQANLTGARVEAVTTWFIPPVAYEGAVPLPTTFDLAPAASSMLDEVVGKVLVDHPGLEVSRVVIEGPPARRLLEAAAGAELLVVGSRGHGAFAGMLLGSVSEHCVSHAPCPVVVVRHTAHPA